MLVHTLVLCWILAYGKASLYQSRAEVWGNELTGEMGDNLPRDVAQRESYKSNLLRYVFQTDEPKDEELNSDGSSVPFVMSKLYELLADQDTGQEKETTPFDVDFIRGLQDHWETERRMQFWFNTSAINSTEDVIEAYFHIYKRRAPRPVTGQSNHRISVSLYKIEDEFSLYAPDGSIGSGGVLIERQQVSAYTSEWIIFKTGLKDLVKDWVKTPSSNKGFLISATDPDENHVNGTHIDFVQRGESPHNKQPVFVVYTDQERKKSNKHKRKQRNNIDFLVDNFLNEDMRRIQTLQDICHVSVENRESMEQCTTVVMRHRRSLLEDPVIQADAYDDEWEDNSGRTRRRLRSRNQNPDLAIEATRRTNNFCQMKALHISFRALGWGKWIVAPDGLNANFCDGICPFPLTSTLTASNHAVLQSVSNYYHPDKVKPPCCVPQKLARMSILYHQTDKTVTMRNYDNMIVETCGCR